MLKLSRLKTWKILLTTDWNWLIKAAWGERRVSSRALAVTSAYPSQLSATLGVWLSWYWKNKNRREYYVVVTADGADHGADYMALVAAREAGQLKERKHAEVLARLDDLNAQRAAAREAKNFELADAIRAEIVAVGIVVKDASVEGGESQ
jgi:cysteinyl-tRNA synthetase